MKIYVVDQQGCEWGGVMKEKAFATQELANKWVGERSHRVPLLGDRFFICPIDSGVDEYEVIELEVEGA